MVVFPLKKILILHHFYVHPSLVRCLTCVRENKEITCFSFFLHLKFKLMVKAIGWHEWVPGFKIRKLNLWADILSEFITVIRKDITHQYLFCAEQLLSIQMMKFSASLWLSRKHLWYLPYSYLLDIPSCHIAANGFEEGLRPMGTELSLLTAIRFVKTAPLKLSILGSMITFCKSIEQHNVLKLKFSSAYFW